MMTVGEGEVDGDGMVSGRTGKVGPQNSPSAEGEGHYYYYYYLAGDI